MNIAPEKLATILLEIAEIMPVNEAKSVRCERLKGGRNNRAFKVVVGEENFFLKQYYTSAIDARNRREAEAAFIAYCELCGTSATPRLIVSSEYHHASLFSFIDGTPFNRTSSIQKYHVSSAIQFFNQLQRSKHSCRLDDASEATWGVSGHIYRLKERLARLRLTPALTAADFEMQRFIGTDLFPYYERINEYAAHCDDLLNSEEYFERIVSPSDFGFHNALELSNGSVVFIDFEYAGWDDPIKTILDFFFQPQCRVPKEMFPSFRDSVLSHTRYPSLHIERLKILAPVLKSIWICTILNEFLGGGGERRLFSQQSVGFIAPETIEERKYEQLKLARQLLSDDVSYMT